MIVLERLSPHYNHRPVGVPISAVIVHDTGGKTAESAVSWFLDPASQVSSHLVIGTDGVVYRCVPDELRAWHAGASSLFGVANVNDFSLGVELVDDRDSDPYPAPQLATLVECLTAWVSAYRIPLNRIVGHCHIAPGRKTDPGPDLQWYPLLLDVARGVAS